MEELEGQIEEIIYQNEVNSYTVAEFQTNADIITVVGYLPFINKGDTLKLFGKYVTHQDYGEQFKIDTFEKMTPQGAEAIQKYLAGGIVKGIGPATAKRIVDYFGENAISVLRFEPEKLADIKGITKEKAAEIGAEFNEKWDLWQIVGFLEKFGISTSNSKKVYEALGKDAIEKIEENPYILLDIVYGVDFKQIDKMAMDMGTEYNDERRIKSAIKYALILSSYNGHTCVLKENLIKFIIDLLDVSTEEIENCLINMKAAEIIIEESRDLGPFNKGAVSEADWGFSTWIYLDIFYKCEKNIADKLIALSESKNMKKIKNFKLELEKTEQNEDIILSNKQREAIKLVNDNNVCVITGMPGTGKTTTIKSIIKMYKNQNMKVVLCAPTGRAAKRISEATGEAASTIHRLLQIGKVADEGMLANIDLQIPPIDADVVIIDEMSMVDVYVMNYILKGIYLGTKLILMGDSNQLPSVGPGNVLEDIIESGRIPTIELDEIFRQAAKSQIITNSHKVNGGETFTEDLAPLTRGLSAEQTGGSSPEADKLHDFFYINEISQNKILDTIISLCTGRLKKYGDYEFFNNIQVLSPTKKGMLGTKELNNALQEALNPSQEQGVVSSLPLTREGTQMSNAFAAKQIQERQHGDRIFRIGDRVMQIKNNYDIFWEMDTGETGTGIFNGELGIVSEFDEESKSIKIIFDDEKNVWYEFSDLDQIEHSYAVTIHKSQGSEFDVVIMCLPKSYPALLTRNLLYTGMTRAKELLIVIGSKQVIDFMVNNVDSKKRNTGLRHKLEE